MHSGVTIVCRVAAVGLATGNNSDFFLTTVSWGTSRQAIADNRIFFFLPDLSKVDFRWVSIRTNA